MGYKIKTREMSRGAWKNRVSDWSSTDPLRFRCATLINRMSITVQAPGPVYADRGEPKTSQRVVWWMPSSMLGQGHVYW